MVWGAVSATGPGPLIVLKGNITSVSYTRGLLSSDLAEWYKTLVVPGGTPPLMQYDMASAHRTCFSINSLAAKGIHLIMGPPNSPELSSIEYVWSQMEKTFSWHSSLQLD